MIILPPIPSGQISNTPFSKTVEISSYNSATIISPVEGSVVTPITPICNGNIKIEHVISGETYYSNFCNVGRVISFRGNRVRQGEVIGNVGNSPVEYTVTNKKGDKLDVNKFLLGKLGKTTDKDKDKEPTNVNSKKSITNPFMSLLLSPLSIVHSAFSEKSSGIKEDIDRIKKLIKY
jgi:hypothetical protein